MADPYHLFGQNTFEIYNPSELVTRKGLIIFDKMKLDDQIKAALAFKKQACISTGWQIVAPKYTESDEVTDFVKWALENFAHDEGDLSPSFNHALLEVLSALDYGFSINEKIWQIVEDGQWAGNVSIKNLKAKHPYPFKFRTDPFGNLYPDGLVQAQNTKDINLPVNKFMIYVYQHEFSNPYGKSDLEAAYRPWWIKDNAYKWLAMLLERLGIPPIFGLYNPSAYTPAQIGELKKIIQNIQSATFGIIPKPKEDSLEFWSPELAQQATNVFIPSLDMLNRDIARAILMPGLMGLSPQQNTGSYSQAQVQFDVFMLTIEHIRMELGSLINQKLIKPLVDFNYIVDGVYPEFRFLPLSDDVKLDVLQKWSALVMTGTVQNQPEDEDHIREMLKFPDRDEKRDVITPGNETDQAAMTSHFKQIRPTNAYERQVNFKEIENKLDGIETSTKGQLKDAFIVVRDALVGYINRNFNNVNPSFVNDIRLKGMGEVQTIIRSFLQLAFNGGIDAFKKEIPKKFTQKYANFAPVDAMKLLNQRALTISGVLRDRLLGDAKMILLNALKYGETQKETTAKLAALFEPYVGDDTVLRDGEEIPAYRLDTIVRTNATDAFNMGRLDMARDPDIAEFIQGMEYSAVIDGRTTEICRFLDGKIIPLEEPELDRISPANHYNCRSILVPVTLDIKTKEEDFITPSEIGKAKELIQEGFK